VSHSSSRAMFRTSTTTEVLTGIGYANFRKPQ
jgi:hypothetical protein